MNDLKYDQHIITAIKKACKKAKRPDLEDKLSLLLEEKSMGQLDRDNLRTNLTVILDSLKQ